LIIKKTCLEKQLVHPGGNTIAFSLALPQFFKSSRDEKVATTQAGKFPKL